MQRHRAFISAILICAIFSLMGCNTLTAPKVEQPVDDPTIINTIKAKIADDPQLRQLNIKVTARKGEVTLSGSVPRRDDQVRVIKLALSVQGVRSVQDNITVKKK